MQLPRTLYSLLLVVPASTPVSATKTVPANDTVCQCFQTNGSNTAYYSQHRFFDFRNLDKFQGPAPPPVKNASAAQTAFATSDFFLSTDWTDNWGIQNWNNSVSPRADSSVLMINSPNNVYIEQNTDQSTDAKTWLTLRTTRQADFQSSAEITTVSEAYKFISIRWLTRTIGDSGGCTALFTYRGTKDTVQEADMEILTKGPRNAIQYTNQPAVDSNGHLIEGATKNVTLPGGREWTQWAVHRMDWTPHKSTWYLDGEETASISYQVPQDPSRIILNSWSDGGGWTGNMSTDSAVHYQIQWIEIVYNSTEPTDAGGAAGESSGRNSGSRGDGGSGGGKYGGGDDDDGEGDYDDDEDDEDEGDDEGDDYPYRGNPWGGFYGGYGKGWRGGRSRPPKKDKRQSPPPAQCKQVCSIDETENTGTPVLLLNDARCGHQISAAAGWLPLVAVLATTYMSAGLLQY